MRVGYFVTVNGGYPRPQQSIPSTSEPCLLYHFAFYIILLVQDFLEYNGIGKIYPRAAAYVAQPKDLSLTHTTTLMDSK